MRKDTGMAAILHFGQPPGSDSTWYKASAAVFSRDFLHWFPRCQLSDVLVL